MNNTLQFIKKHRIVIIFRGQKPEECLEIAKVLMEEGIRLFEVTMNTPDAVDAIKLLHSELGPEAMVGAGTVLRADEVDLVARAGASYIISPNVNLDVIHRTKELGLISIPGALSPTETMTAWEAGADIIKVFPINVLGAQYITQLKGPLDNIPFMPTGGICLELVEELFEEGAVAIGMGVNLLGKDLVQSKNWGSLRRRASEFIKAAGL